MLYVGSAGTELGVGLSLHYSRLNLGCRIHLPQFTILHTNREGQTHHNALFLYHICKRLQMPTVYVVVPLGHCAYVVHNSMV